mmetsp:Transcript_74788/g.206193  ORF Transcript_74788/g.206193 Transcript_74788/m.206193 type:complete len:204 (+) Transcript_74788:1783-2394(+)
MLDFRSSARAGAERSNPSRLRSTPFAATRAVRANLATSARAGKAASATRAGLGGTGTAAAGPYIKAMATSSLTLSTATSSTPTAEMRPLRSAVVLAASGTREATGSRGAIDTVRRSRPKAMPPYTLFFLLAPISASPWIRPSRTPILEWKRSFHSWGTSKGHFTAASLTARHSVKLNQESSRLTSASMRNLARTEALASSRRW